MRITVKSLQKPHNEPQWARCGKPFWAVVAFLCMLSMQSLALAHDVSHLNHDETETCALLSNYSAGKDTVSTECGTRVLDIHDGFAQKLITGPEHTLSISHHRPRSPPKL